MFYLILFIHVGLCLALVFLVLLQQGKGADLGAALGGASSAFGPGSSANVLTRVTTGIAVAFMVTSIILVRTYSAVAPELGVSSEVQDPLRGSVMEKLSEAEVVEKSDGKVVASVDEPDKNAEENGVVKALPEMPKAEDVQSSQVDDVSK